MVGINLTRSFATLAVVAGLLAVSGSASAARTEEPIAPPHTDVNSFEYTEIEWNVVSHADPHAGAGNDRPNRTQAGILDGSSNTLETGLLGSAKRCQPDREWLSLRPVLAVGGLDGNLARADGIDFMTRSRITNRRCPCVCSPSSRPSV